MRKAWSHKILVEMDKDEFRMLGMAFGALEQNWAWGLFGLNLNTVDGRGQTPPKWCLREDCEHMVLILEWEPTRELLRDEPDSYGGAVSK